MHFLIAAFIVTWVIHGVYLGILARGYSRVREEFKELRR
jgi:hypothetical protein